MRTPSCYMDTRSCVTGDPGGSQGHSGGDYGVRSVSASWIRSVHPRAPHAPAHIWGYGLYRMRNTLLSVREEGLPLVPGLSPAQRADLRFRQLFALVQITHDFEAYGERSRSAAMLALAEVSGSDLTSLRKEEWEAWWNDFRTPEVARINELMRSESQGQQDGTRP